jgi:hypothetical protein
MRPTSRFALTVLAAAAIALAISAVPILLREDQPTAVQPTPKPGVQARAGEIRTARDVGAPTRRAVVADISKTLQRLYSRAFVQPQETPGPNDTPRPAPAKRVRASMTKIARSALAKSPGIFDEAADLTVYSGVIRFGGLVTFEGKRPLEALLDVDFAGDAVPVGSLSPAVRVRQRGTIVLKNSADGWLVDGFDLRFATRPFNTPTPRPR